MSKKEKIVFSLVLIALGVLFQLESPTVSLIMLGCGALLALSLLIPKKVTDPLMDKKGMPKDFQKKVEQCDCDTFGILDLSIRNHRNW